ncbi:hypothetical protein CEXT_360501 [Caerostris extrusa]|uniref:Uncharacterized protein n=1 Tax=Caerostris extrusa TaxID=172846 RepID=A0AAV4NFS9_CAEEX|nr:hypothetical protein CEXT_360501 [Caerostris extrusa]
MSGSLLKRYRWDGRSSLQEACRDAGGNSSGDLPELGTLPSEWFSTKEFLLNFRLKRQLCCNLKFRTPAKLIFAAFFPMLNGWFIAQKIPAGMEGARSRKHAKTLMAIPWGRSSELEHCLPSGFRRMNFFLILVRKQVRDII